MKGVPTMTRYQEALAIESDLVRWHRTLHQIPELDLTLPKTTAYIAAELEKMGVAFEVKPDISCIFAVIGQGSPCILLRSDMDALPIVEQSGEPFAATGEWSHGCGHDIHAATLLGAAKLLKANEKDLKGTVKLLFQSGEETFRGAAAAVEAGVLENPKVDAAFAMHAFAGSPLGEILYGIMPMAAVYGFQLTLTGRGGHGSQPERCIDPINAAVQVYLALQSLLARENPPTEDASLTIGQFTAGAAANAIPQTAVLKGTLRTFKPEVRSMLIRRIGEISQAVSAAYRCTCDLEVLSNVPSVICDEAFLQDCLKSIEASGAEHSFQPGLHLMGSEDFAVISEQVPSCYVVGGAGVPDPSRWRGQHNPEIVFNEDCLAQNAAAYVQVAMDFLNK